MKTLRTPAETEDGDTRGLDPHVDYKIDSSSGQEWKCPEMDD